MKKIFIIIFILFLCTSCMDYKEASDLSVVSSVIIDYENSKYTVTFEILATQDEDMSYFVKGTGMNITEAIENAKVNTLNEVTFNHVKLMIISTNVDLSNITDYFLRSKNFRDNFYVITASNVDKLLEINFENKTLTDEIINLVDNYGIIYTFDELVQKLNTEGIDICISSITADNDTITLDGLSIYKEYNYITTLDTKYLNTYKVLTKMKDNITITNEYNDKSFSVSINNIDINISVDNKINITGTITGNIIDNSTDFNILNTTVIKSLNNDFSNIINEDINEFLELLKFYDTDILGISRIYYIKTRTLIDFNIFDINTNIDFNINKKGLIYEE